jgi:hypothetical protein
VCLVSEKGLKKFRVPQAGGTGAEAEGTVGRLVAPARVVQLGGQCSQRSWSKGRGGQREAGFCLLVVFLVSLSDFLVCKVREIAGLKNKLQISESKLDETERELKKAKEERDKLSLLLFCVFWFVFTFLVPRYHGQAEDLQRKIQNLNAASASTGDAASAASQQVKVLKSFFLFVCVF